MLKGDNSAFKASWWLANPHFQTLWPALFRRRKKLELTRERIITPDGDFLDVDWCGDMEKPLVLVLHGLTGSSQSSYVAGMQRALSRHGFCSAALNFRGCSGEPNLTSRCYHSGKTTDIDFLYRYLIARDPNKPIAVIGYSLGGNALLKWLGEQEHKLELFAAVAVSAPLQLNLCADRMDSGFSKVYRNRLINELKDYIHNKRRYLRSLGITGEVEILEALGDLAPIRSFWEYDNQVVAQLYGFNDVHDYYAKSSARQFLKNIKINTLIIHALDDPFMTPEVIPEKSELSDAVRLEVTAKGGHVGFIAGNIPGRHYYWLEQRIPAFLKKQLVMKSLPY
jgi:predicted alpha/beta-fold hydrolase